MNVLSLFDGMGCGRIALERAGIPVARYYASEIDKYAISVMQANYPDTIQLGDIRGINPATLPKIDLIIGGSPCQGFSTAGKGKGFDDPRSALFFEYVRLLGFLQAEYYLLENVRMKENDRDIISYLMGVEPTRINSALVSAQNRVRDYWTNIPGVSQPLDRNILLADIIESGVTDREKAHCLDRSYYKAGSPGDVEYYFTRARRQLIFSKVRLRYGSKHLGFCAFDGKSPTITANRWEMNNFLADVTGYRKLTPIECERLQTVPDDYTAGVSNTQRYKMLGNGWTVDVIAHILKGIK